MDRPDALAPNIPYRGSAPQLVHKTQTLKRVAENGGRLD
jgi:hypothetical protein